MPPTTRQPESATIPETPIAGQHPADAKPSDHMVLMPGTCSTAPRTRCYTTVLCSFRCAASRGRGRYQTRNARPDNQRWANAGARCGEPTVGPHGAPRMSHPAVPCAAAVGAQWPSTISAHPVALDKTRAVSLARRVGCVYACAAVMAPQTSSGACPRGSSAPSGGENASSRACAPGAATGTGSPRPRRRPAQAGARRLPRQRRPSRAPARQRAASPSQASHLPAKILIQPGETHTFWLPKDVCFVFAIITKRQLGSSACQGGEHVLAWREPGTGTRSRRGRLRLCGVPRGDAPLPSRVRVRSSPEAESPLPRLRSGRWTSFACIGVHRRRGGASDSVHVGYRWQARRGTQG